MLYHHHVYLCIVHSLSAPVRPPRKKLNYKHFTKGSFKILNIVKLIAVICVHNALKQWANSKNGFILLGLNEKRLIESAIK